MVQQKFNSVSDTRSMRSFDEFIRDLNLRPLYVVVSLHGLISEINLFVVVWIDFFSLYNEKSSFLRQEVEVTVVLYHCLIVFGFKST